MNSSGARGARPTRRSRRPVAGFGRPCEKTRAATEDELLAQAKKHADWFLRCGTTTVEAKSGYGLSVDDEMKILRVMRRLNDGNAG